MEGTKLWEALGGEKGRQHVSELGELSPAASESLGSRSSWVFLGWGSDRANLCGALPLGGSRGSAYAPVWKGGCDLRSWGCL